MPARALLLLLVCARAHGGLLTAKEYICKDPDTGSLHPVNSTWRSTTFCGNYTCKLRSLNAGSGDSPPASKIIVNLTGPQARMTNNEINESQREKFVHGLSLSKILPDLSKDDDRLLNAAEIKKISELLHTVKKSDLQAVIELYNVAQEIYKGMKAAAEDKKDPDDADYDNERDRAMESKLKDLTRPVFTKVSYWYEPSNNGYRKDGDMKPEGSEYKQTTAYPVRKHYDPPFFYSSRNSHYPSYFSGTVLSNDDFGRLGYYHPQANIQRAPPYYQPRNMHVASGPAQNTPCSPTPCSRAYQYQTPMPPPNYSPQQSLPNALQPYPPSYDYSSHANHYNNYYKGNPWAYYDYYRNLPYQRTSPIQNTPVAGNTEGLAKTENQNGDAINENSAKEDEKSWKTDPLPETVINEVRANIAERGKLLNIPLKKRIKLERAAKLIKLDQFNNRKTRSVSVSTKVDGKETISSITEKTEEVKDNHRNYEVVETYLEKVMCEPSTELGFFRIGNMTRPYPECCPEKIEDK